MPFSRRNAQTRRRVLRIGSAGGPPSITTVAALFRATTGGQPRSSVTATYRLALATPTGHGGRNETGAPAMHGLCGDVGARDTEDLRALARVVRVEVFNMDLDAGADRA